MSCTSWKTDILNYHGSTLTNLANCNNSGLDRNILGGTFAGWSGSSVVPTPTSVDISGKTSTSGASSLAGIGSVYTGCNCVSSNYFPIVSDCGCGSLFGLGGWGMDSRTYNALSWNNSTNIYDNMSSSQIWGATWSKMQLNAGNLVNNLLFGNSNMFNCC